MSDYVLSDKDILVEMSLGGDGRWHGKNAESAVSDAITMQAEARWREEEQKEYQSLYDVALAKAGDKDAVKRVEGQPLWSWSLTKEAAADAENTEDVLGYHLSKRYGTGDPGAVWDAMNASPDYEYEQMPVWNKRAEGTCLVWQRFRKMVEGKKAAADAALAAVNERMKGLEAYVDGKEAKRDVSGKLAADAVDDRELWKLVEAGHLSADAMQRAQEVRAFMQAYVLPLGKLAEMDERMRGLDGLRDEVFELVGEDKDTARLFYESLMRWAGEMSAKNDTGAGDEFQVAIGKKLSDWSRAHLAMPEVSLAPVGHPDAPVEFTQGQREAFLSGPVAEFEKKRLSAGILRAAMDEAMKLPEGSGFWGSVWQGLKNAPRLAARLGGDTAPYFLPGVGAYAGAADTLVRGATSGVDARVLDYEFGGNAGGYESRGAMRVDAMMESGIAALVEALPFGAVGGTRLSKWLGGKLSAATGGRYVPGRFTRGLVKATQRSWSRALLADFGANVVTEGVLEPIAQGALTLTAEGVMDMAGVPHGVSASFAEAFAELGEMWDPDQLVGFLLFSAAVTAPAAPAAVGNARKYAKVRDAWEAMGLTPKQAEEVVSAEDSLEAGRAAVLKGWQEDAEGMRTRLVAKHDELKASGRTLVFTGADTGLDAESAKVLAAAWELGQKRYHLPEVQLVGDGKVKVTRAEVPGVADAVDLTLTEAQADVFLAQELGRIDSARLKDWQERGLDKEGFSKVQEKLADLVDRAMGDVAVDAAVAEGSVDVEAMGKGLPEDLQELIRAAGGMTVPVAKKISEWAAERVEELVEGGMSERSARAESVSAEGGATLGELMGMGAGLAKRERAAGLAEGSARTALHRRRGGRAVQFNGRSVLGSVLVHARGGATGVNAVEDVSESVFDMMVQERAQVILENQAAAREAAGESVRPATMSEAAAAEEQAWSELAEVARKAREALLKVDGDLVIEEVDGSRLNTIEALSSMALSRYVGSGVLPGWMNGLQKVLRDNVQAAHAVAKLQEAMVALGEKSPAELKELLDWLDAAGVQVGKSLAAARADAVVDRMRELECWNAGAVAAGAGGVGGMSVSLAQEEVLEEEDEIQQNDRAREAVAAAKSADAAKREDEADREMFERDTNKGTVPKRMRGVFVGDVAGYQAAGDFWWGSIDKHKLRDGTEQVKVGEKGKHGVIKGRELTGRFINDTDPIRVWKRKNGELWVISGRHRFAKRMEDETGNDIMCFVYEETEERDEKWARLKDYEQNMRDDQADEVTCAVYARETGKTEMEMFDEGLTRNGSRSKRGIFIGQNAREELWTRFRNGDVKPMDAELVCKLTASLADQSQVAEIQAHCCGLLKAGKSWDYIGASVQLMASSQAQQAEQMLLDLGADFTANLERMARWVELCRKAFREAIDLLKDEKRRVKKGAKASRLGLSATMTEEKREEMLGDLVAMDAKFEMIGSYPELVAEAKLWDGDESKFSDPVAMYLERVEAMQEEGLQEEQARRAAEEATPTFSWSLTGGRIPLAENQVKVSNKAIVTFKDGVVRNKSSRVLRSDGREVWARFPEIVELKEAGFPGADVFLEVGSLRGGFLHLAIRHGEEIQALYPDVPLFNAIELFVDEVFSKLGKARGSYVGKGKKRKLDADSAPYETNSGKKKKKRVSLSFHKAPNAQFYTVDTAFEAAEDKEFARVKVEKDGQSCTVTVELDGKALGLPTSATLNPPSAWPLHARRPDEGDNITPDSNVKAEDIGFAFLRKAKHPDVEAGARTKDAGNFSASLTGGKNLAAVHSLSAEKFLSAVELGGMPMPSVAVTRLDRPYEWGGAGAISLVGKPDMVDPRKKSKVYMHDAYTGKMPPVMYRKKNREEVMKLKADALEKLAPYGMGASDGLMSGLFSDDYNEQVVDGYSADWGNNRAMMAYWAITQAGYSPRPKKKEAEGLLSPALYKALKPWEKKLPKGSLFSDEFTAEMIEGLREAMIGYFEGKGKSQLADVYRKMDEGELRLQAVDWAGKVRRHSTKKMPDGVENWRRFAAYVEKHAKAYKAWCAEQMSNFLGDKIFSRKFVRRNWRGEVVDEWWGHEKYTLGNLMKYMREEKGRGEESASMSPGVFLAVMSEEFRSMREMQAKRDRIVDSESHQDAREEWQKVWDKFNKLAYDLKKPGWGSYFDIADSALWRLLELVSGGRYMPSREAVEKKLNESKDGWTDEHVDAAMELLSQAVAMPSDYMEAIPQRAVKMHEWEYAVLPVGLKKNKAVVAALRENGIKPVWHDGTEEGRRAALAGLVDNETVSFSVIGRNARTWDRYVDRAFAGRDDGMWRAEIDASGAMIRWEDLRGKNVAAYRKLVSGWDKLPEAERKAVEAYAEKAYDYQDESQKLNNTPEDAFLEQYNTVIKLRDALKPQREEVRTLLNKLFVEHGGSAAAVLNMKDTELDELAMSLWGPYVESKVEEMLDLRPLWNGGMRLADVMDYPELYEAYPELADVVVRYVGMETANGRAIYGNGEPEIQINRNLEGEWKKIHSILLHETQHHIQNIEGFAKGGNPSYARRLVDKRAAMGDADALAFREHSDMELYHRFAGEIESRNVQLRRDWSAEKRAAVPFNDTLEYPGEALVTFSVQRKRDLTLDDVHVTQEAAWEHLEGLEGKPLRNARSRFVAVVNKPQRKELTNLSKAWKSADNGYSIASHYAAVSRLDKLFLHAVPCGEYPDSKNGKSDVTIFRFACPVLIGGEKAVAWMTAKKSADKKGSERLYNLELVDIEKLAGTIESAQQRAARFITDKVTPPPASGDIVAEVEEAFKTYFEDVPEVGSNFSASLTGAASRVLEDSGDEYVANRLREAWLKNLEKWSVLNAGKADSNSAMRAVMEMEGLVKATYDVVEGDAKLGRLYMLQRWAMVYARMVESGEIPPKGALKGQAYERFVERLTEEQRTEMRRGMSRGQAEELVRELGVTRLEGAMERVARECLRAAEAHLKQKETERVHRLLEAAWPKREEGKKSPRGKLEAREYRRLEWIKEVMEYSGQQKYDEMNNLKERLEALPIEQISSEEEIALLQAELAGLDPKAADYVEKKVDKEKQLREVKPGRLSYADEKAELEDHLNLLHVFGGWAEMDVTQARKAARVLEDLLLRGRTEWEQKLQRERERTRAVAREISSHFKAAWYARKNEKQKNEVKANTNKFRQVKDVAHVAMSYAQMMLALRRKMGKVFCDRQRRTIAEAHRNLLTAQKDLQDWTQMELQKITGLTGAALEQWIASNNQAEKTGIMRRMVRTEKVEMSADEVKSLEKLGAAEFDAWRAEELARMEDEGRYRVLPTWEEFLQLKDIRLLRKVRIRTKMIPELQALGKEKYEAWREKKLAEAKARRAEAKEDKQDEPVLPTFEQLERLKLLREMGGSGISVTRTEEQMVELVATKEALLYAVLLFEQPDYEHLVEAHGLTGEDVDAMKKIIGPKLLRWGYAMRRHLSENGQMLAAKYEAWNGVPFGMRENYFRGVFDVNKLKPEVDIKEGDGAGTLGGSKYGILIPRRYHQAQIDWLQGASQVFMMTMNEQNNYIHTQHITREWRQLLSNREFAEGFKTEIGTSLLNMIKLHLDVIDAAPRADAAISASARKITRGIMRALAISALSFNPGSLIKQVSCLLNAIPGGYVPDKVVKQSGVYQVLTYSGIGAGELMKGYAHVFSGNGAVSMKELVASNVFRSRIQSKGKRVADVIMTPQGQKVSVGLGRTADVVGEYGLELMDVADRNLNVIPAAVVADAVYRKLMSTDAGREAGVKWCREQAIEAAGLMLDLVAQPKLRTQKGLWASHGGWGGGLGDFLFMFRSEVLAKMGTYFAQLFSGQKGRAFAGYMSFGALAFLVKFMLDFVTGKVDGDDLDDEEDWKKLARKSLAEIVLNDLCSIPAVGSGFELLKSEVGGTRYYTHDPLANVIPINELYSKSKRAYKVVAADDGLWSFKIMRALSNWAKACGCASGLLMGTGSTICNTAMSIILG